jgi:hypothetical protein
MGNRWRTYMTTPCRWIVVSYSFVDHDADVLLALAPTALLVIDSPSQVKNPTAVRTVATSRLLTAAGSSLMLLNTPGHYKADEWEFLVDLALKPRDAAEREEIKRMAQEARDHARRTIWPYMGAITKND